MLSIAKLTPGQEGYYERSVAAGIDDYYAGRGESPGIWAGRGAQEPELEAVVGDGQLGRLVRGFDPLSGDRLRRHPPARTIRVERVDPETGERRRVEKKLRPVAGFDLCLGAPKSVSLLHALGDERTRLAVNQARTAAWQAALAYLEQEACVTRKGRNGVIRERGSGFVAASYQHRTSRAQNPHLHTHVIVANMARSPDGVWRALEGEATLKTYRLAAGALYQVQLRYELSRSLGVEWEQPVKGMAEIKGIPAQVLFAFSQRRGQLLDYLAAQGTSGFYAAQVAALETRERKQDVDVEALREEWWARAAEHGLDRAELDALLERAPRWRPLSSVELRGSALRLFGPSGLTEKQTTFTEPELQLALTEAHVQGAPAERIRVLCERFLRLEGVEPVEEEAGPGRPGRYTTSELVRVERAALALVEGGRDTGAPVVNAGTVDRVVARSRGQVRLGDDQARDDRLAPSRRRRVEPRGAGADGASGTTRPRATRARRARVRDR